MLEVVEKRERIEDLHIDPKDNLIALVMADKPHIILAHGKKFIPERRPARERYFQFHKANDPALRIATLETHGTPLELMPPRGPSPTPLPNYRRREEREYAQIRPVHAVYTGYGAVTNALRNSPTFHCYGEYVEQKILIVDASWLRKAVERIPSAQKFLPPALRFTCEQEKDS